LDGSETRKKHSVAVWRNIEHLMSTGDKESLKQAFLLMNELLAEVLSRIVSSGDNLIDQVKNLKIAEISESDKAKLLVGVYAYDKIKNDPTFNLESNEIEFFFKLYRQIFRSARTFRRIIIWLIKLIKGKNNKKRIQAV